MTNRTIVTVAAIILAAAGQTRADLLTSYSLVDLGNLSSNSDVQGPTLVVGNLSGGTSGYGANAQGSPYTLVVGGNVLSGVGANVQGSVAIGGTNSGTVNANGGTTVTNSSFAQSQASSASSLLSQANAAFTALVANSPTPTVPSMNGNMTFTVSSSVGAGVAVFTVDASKLASLNSLNAHIALDTSADPTLKSVVINVTNTTKLTSLQISQFDGSFQGNFGESKVMWNFVSNSTYSAPSTISLNNSFYGAIMAPSSFISDNSQPINGATFIAGFNNTQTGEVHVPLYTGYDPLSVPEPGSIALLGVGATVLAFGSRLRRMIGRGRAV